MISYCSLLSDGLCVGKLRQTCKKNSRHSSSNRVQSRHVVLHKTPRASLKPLMSSFSSSYASNTCRRSLPCIPALPKKETSFLSSGSVRTFKRGELQPRRTYGGGGPPGGQEGSNTKAIVNIITILGFLYLLFNTGVGKFFLYAAFFLWLAVNIVPPLLAVGLAKYAENNLIEAPCPNCGTDVQVLKQQSEIQCMACGTICELDGETLVRKGPSFEQQSQNPFSQNPYAQNPFMGSSEPKKTNGSQDVIIDAEVIDIDPKDVKK